MILFTSDWQAEHHNLDRVEAVVQQSLEICKQHKCQTIVHCGDIKNQYNPIDIRVVNYMSNVIDRYKAAGIRFIANLGNHDRVGMFDTADNWFPTLSALGAETFAHPDSVSVGKYELFMLPFMESASVIEWADNFAASANKKNSILVFHSELDKCRFNVLTQSSGGDLKTRHLHPNKYLYCIGGHIHLPQNVRDNVFFVGSPFAEDWGEANQRKRFLLLTRDGELKSIRSKIPGMYDPTWPGFHTPKAGWKGTSVRIHVSCTRSDPDVSSTVDRAKAKAEKKYAGATIVVVPEFEDDGDDSLSLKDASSDLEVVSTYITQHCPKHLDGQQDAIIAYLLHKLSEVSSVMRSKGKLQFLSAKAKNFLPFKNVKCNFRKPGITVVSGVNEDWPGRSNGSGKTSFLQLASVAIHGKSLKKQKHDRWMRRGIEKQESWVKLVFKASDKLCNIIRGRRPKKLQLIVDGTDESTGIGPKGTQQAIEALTMSWEVLKNTIYIDQAEINGLLGSETQRRAIFTNFLNLERFSKARELIRHARTATDVRHIDATHSQDLLATEKNHILVFLKQIASLRDIREVKSQYLKAFTEWQTAKRNGREFTNTVKDRDKDAVSRCRERREWLLEKYAALRSRHASVSDDVESMQELRGKSTCPVCKQSVAHEHIKKHKMLLCNQLQAIESKLSVIAASRKVTEEKLYDAEDKVAKMIKESAFHSENITKLEERMRAYKERWKDAKKAKKVRLQYNKRLSAVDRKLVSLQLYLKQIRDSLWFLDYCAQVFSKDGIPAYLAVQLCPLLNNAAELYSRLFSEGEIHVKFALTDDKSMDVSIVNVHGGELLLDQSEGERRVASIITSFALCDVLSTCNLLILDEPGEGLDRVNARVFARALPEVAERFGTILLTTHNPYILAELADERQVTVVKKGRVARIKQ